MKMLVVMGAEKRFVWQAEVMISSLDKIGVKPEDCYIITSGEGEKLNDLKEHLLPYGVKVFNYKDERPTKNYILSLYHWLLHQFFTNEENNQDETFFLVDNDILFLDSIDFSKMDISDKQWYGTECGDFDSFGILSETNKLVLETIFGALSPELVNKYQFHTVGGQYIIKTPPKDFFLDVYYMCEVIYTYLFNNLPENYENKKHLGRNITDELWYSEMWAMMYVCEKYGISLDSHELLDDTLLGEPYENIHDHAIYHNTGGIMVNNNASKELFNRDNYKDKSPFGETIEVSSKYASFRYVEAIKQLYPETIIIDSKKIDEHLPPVNKRDAFLRFCKRQKND